MKKIFYILTAVLLLLPASLCAQEKNKNKTEKLRGTWQLCQLRVDEEDAANITILKRIPIFKTMTQSGDLTATMFVVDKETKDAVPVTTLLGKYEIESDSTYYEYIERSRNPSLNGKTMAMNYQIIDDKYLIIKFTMKLEDGEDYEGYETWIKLDFYEPQPQKEK